MGLDDTAIVVLINFDQQLIEDRREIQLIFRVRDTFILFKAGHLFLMFLQENLQFLHSSSVGRMLFELYLVKMGWSVLQNV